MTTYSDKWISKRHVTLNLQERKISKIYSLYKNIEIIPVVDLMETKFKDYEKFPIYVEAVEEWIANNTLGRCGFHTHRVVRQITKHSNEIEYVLNEINGFDILVFIFTEEKDHMWFKLKWL